MKKRSSVSAYLQGEGDINSPEPSSLFHHSVLVHSNVSLMMLKWR